MGEVVLKRIFLEAMEALDGAGREEFEKLTESNTSPEDVESFFRTNIENYDDLVQNVIAKFKSEMIAAQG